ncbi:phage holin family protein [Falsihalocynthiibacter sp. SS001]|uniref:phage holin family protein n=1 Tax=Falsihalocynthiibacter sp. SS001 TaxID=3349698 RepID=UPI0036D21641
MIELLQSLIQEKAERAKRSAGLSLMAVAMFAVAALFLTMAAWFALLTVASPALASMIVGLVYLSVGCIFIGLKMVFNRQPPPEPEPTPQPVPLLEAFLTGMQAGANARRPKPDRNDDRS